jgi:hypothetical protein
MCMRDLTSNTKVTFRVDAWLWAFGQVVEFYLSTKKKET